MYSEINPFLYLRRFDCIKKIDIDPRLIDCFKEILLKLASYFEETGLLSARDYHKLFDDWLLSGKFKICVSNEPSKINAAGFYRKSDNVIHIDESCLKKYSYLINTLCHEFIHFLAMHDHSYYKTFERVLNEGYTEILARKVLENIGAHAYQPCVLMTNFITALNDTNINFKRFLGELYFDIDGLSKEFKEALSKYFEFGSKNHFNMEEARNNPDYIEAQRIIIRDNLKKINSLDDLDKFLYSLKYRPCSDEQEMQNIYGEIADLLANKLSKSRAKRDFLAKHISKYINSKVNNMESNDINKDDLIHKNEREIISRVLEIDDADFDIIYKSIKSIDSFSKIYRFTIDKEAFKSLDLLILRPTSMYVVVSDKKLYVFYDGKRIGTVEDFKCPNGQITDGILYSLNSLISPAFLKREMCKLLKMRKSETEINKIIEDYKMSDEYDILDDKDIKGYALLWYVEKVLSAEEREELEREIRENFPRMCLFFDESVPFVSLVDKDNNPLYSIKRKFVFSNDDELIRVVLRNDFTEDLPMDDVELYDGKVLVWHESNIPEMKYSSLYDTPLYQKIINGDTYSDNDAYLLSCANALYLELTRKVGFVPQPGGTPPFVTILGGNKDDRIIDMINEHPDAFALLKKVCETEKSKDDSLSYFDALSFICDTFSKGGYEVSERHSVGNISIIPSLYDTDFYKLEKSFLDAHNGLARNFYLRFARVNLLYYDTFNYAMSDDEEYYKERIVKVLEEDPSLFEILRDAYGIETQRNPNGFTTKALASTIKTINEIRENIKQKK